MGLCALLAFGLNTTSLVAQDPAVHSEWVALEESPKLIDVSYRVITCTGANPEIHFNVFNENASAQSLSFSLEITDNGSGNKTTVSVTNLSLSSAEMRIASCDAYPELKIAVPDGFNPSNLSLHISYL